MTVSISEPRTGVCVTKFKNNPQETRAAIYFVVCEIVSPSLCAADGAMYGSRRHLAAGTNFNRTLLRSIKIFNMRVYNEVIYAD